VFIGAWLIFVSRKGAPGHRALGYAYLTLMTVTAIAALFVHQIAPDNPLGLSPIHLFVPLTLFSVFTALTAAKRGDIKSHRGAMLGLFFGGIVLAGAFAFMPGRIMHEIVFAAK
jgi:uncharacterized membrane protein